MKTRALVTRLLRGCFPSLATLRVSLFLTLVSLGLAALAARSVRADMGELGLAAGRQLDRLEDLTAGAEELLVNGARFRHSAAYTKQSVAEVLDRFEQECERTPGLLGQGLRALPERALSQLDPAVPRASRNAAIRDESENGGMLVCFVGARPATLLEFKSRLEHFAATLDLAELGDLRYTYASRKGDETRVITLWTDSALNLAQMFPESGDASGSDSELAPRPPAARRTLTAAAVGQPFALRVYESRKTEAELEAFYDGQLRASGFVVGEGARADGTTAFVRRDGTEVFVSLASLDGKTFVTLTEARGQDASIAVQELSE